MTSAARILPLPPEEWSDALRELLTADLGEKSPLGARRLSEFELFTTLARHERTFSSLMRLGRDLVMNAALSPQDRELLILRTARNCRSDYEWGQHVRIAVSLGLEDAAVERVLAGPEADGWDERQQLLLRAADELHAAARIEEATWVGLSRVLTEKALIEVPLVVGYYHLVAFALGALAVQVQPGLDRLPPATPDEPSEVRMPSSPRSSERSHNAQ